MNTGLKLVVVGATCLVLGTVAGIAATQLVQSSVGDMAARDFRFSFERLASRDGAAKSLEHMQRSEKNLLALQTIGLGQQFDRISEEQLRTEAVRIAKLVEANPELQAPLTGQMTRWAAESRRCILEKFSDPAAVVACVRNSENATPVSKPQHGQVASL